MTSVRSWAILLLAASIRQVNAKRFEMPEGACATIYHEQKWMDEDALHNWDYKIIVRPWTVFGKVSVKLHGIDMRVEHVYGAAGETGSDHVTVELNNHGNSGCEDCFEISGTGQPSGQPTLSCSGLLEEDELSTCPLGVAFNIISLNRPHDPGGGNNGAFTAQAKVKTWVEPTDMTLAFDAPLLISDVWNGEVKEGGVMSKSVTIRLKKSVGSWYGERKSCFGFSAAGMLSRLPRITCKISKPMPAPPPPSPPATPPGVPPYYSASQRACFLGGGATFVDAPDLDPIGGWMKPWQVAVKLDRWVVGTQIVLDFNGDRLVAHPLKILKVDPETAVRRESLTKHSVVLILAPSPVESFTVTGSGAVEGMRELNCCCDAPPPSPPSPPPPPILLSPAPPLPPPPPEPPMHPISPAPSPSPERDIIGRGRPSPPWSPPLPQAPPDGAWAKIDGTSSSNMTLAVAALVMLAGLAFVEVRHRQRRRKLQPLRALKKRMQAIGTARSSGFGDTMSSLPWSSKKEGLQAIPLEDPDEQHTGSKTASSGNRRGGMLILEDATPTGKAVKKKKQKTDDDGAPITKGEQGQDETPADGSNGGGDESSAGADSTSGPRLLIQLSDGFYQELRIQTTGVKSMADLQEAVGLVCGTDLQESEQMRLGDLIMQFVDSHGMARTVTEEVRPRTLLKAKELRLVSASAASDDPQPAAEVRIRGRQAAPLVPSGSEVATEEREAAAADATRLPNVPPLPSDSPLPSLPPLPVLSPPVSDTALMPIATEPSESGTRASNALVASMDEDELFSTSLGSARRAPPSIHQDSSCGWQSTSLASLRLQPAKQASTHTVDLD